MIYKEVGFRPLYHNICAFELNDKLKKLIKDCPDASKSSHAVVYGYIDSKKGMMLEILGGGKQAPKYFYFKDPYEGKRISIPASEVEDVEFMIFPDLAPRFQKQYEPRIKKLKRYNPSEDVEKSRTFDFLDACRSYQYPDDIKVIIAKDNLKPEEVRVRLTSLEQPFMVGTLLNQPYQSYGINQGDTIRFFIKEMEDKSIKCFADLDEPKQLTEEDLKDGSFLKGAMQEFLKNVEDKEMLITVLRILKSSHVAVPCDVQLNEEATRLMDQLSQSGKDIKDLSEKEQEIIQKGTRFLPICLEADGHSFFPVFTNNAEYDGHLEEASTVIMPFMDALNFALDVVNEIDGIVVNAYSENLFVDKEFFGMFNELEPLFENEERLGQLEDNTEFFSNFPGLEMRVGKMDFFNFALSQNRVPPICGIQLYNQLDNPLEGLSMRITSDFHFFRKYECDLPMIPSGKVFSIPDPQLIISGKELASLTEAVDTLITIEICNKEEVLCGIRGTMKVLAYDQWHGSESYLDLLSAFVMPNHPVIPMLMHDASEILGKWRKHTSLEGYQQHLPNRVRELAAAAYAAIQKKNIVYAESPKGFSAPGQRIRTPETIMEQRLGTCMDMTLLYAGLLEAIGLHPILVLIKGHIFVGIWLKQRSVEELRVSNVTIDDIEQLYKRFDNGTDDLTFIECTAMCSGKNTSFEEAEQIAKHNILPDTFECGIDVYMSRLHGIQPMAARRKEDTKYNIDVEDKSYKELTEAPKELDIQTSASSTKHIEKPTGKRALWENKLLDLSYRNMLLNLPHNSSIETIMSSHVYELEDALSDGHEFNLLPMPNNGISEWIKEVQKEVDIFEIDKWPVGQDEDINEAIRREYRNHRLYTFCTEKQLERELTTIYRAARASQQENGVSSLYLAVGLLRWFMEGKDTPCYAPLILVPIEIIRKSANQGYALHARDEESRFNTTLLEMLRQQYNLEIPGLDPLPADDHGSDIKKIFSMVRNKLITVKGWDVIETCVIGNFSFAQFAMWNDIHTSGELLNNSKIVRSLMKGHIDWNTNVPDIPNMKPSYLPITVDATQLEAINMAAQGKTFVLHGPPGTGKSQTITAMIANLLAQGKRVLFVAEKMAALSVVQKRLASLGIDDFCLELHSNKANKKQVLTQLEKALSIKRPEKESNYDEILRRNNLSRERLDEYANHLHKIYNCGYSLRELVSLYETVRDEEQYIPFDREKVGSITKEDLKVHLPLIGQLIANGRDIKGIDISKLETIGLTNYGSNIRYELPEFVHKYKNCILDSKKMGDEVAYILKIEEPKSYMDLSKLSLFIRAYEEAKTMDFQVLSVNPRVYDFFDLNSLSDSKEKELLKIWKPDFLRLNMNKFLEKHEAAGKKFFGRGNAMSAITAEVQAYARIKISYEEIPSMLNQVIDYQRSLEKVRTAYHQLSSFDKELLEKYPSRFALQNAYNEALENQKRLNNFPGGKDAILNISRNPNYEQAFKELLIEIETLNESKEQVNNILVRKDSNRSFEEELEFCNYLSGNNNTLKDWILYNKYRKECIKVGLAPVVKAFEEGMDEKVLYGAYKKGLYYALINHIISHDDVLSCFSGATFNESIVQFKKMDDVLLEQSKQEIYYQLASRVPTSWDSPTVGKELNLLRKAIGSNARGMSIRNLFERIPTILQKLCPCMLMSPNSVAQYLAQNNDLFDVVIFDEASQLPTCKAIGALSRAKDAVIVGDPKQMPPTSFFSGSGPEVADLELDDLDSILDDALALGIPSQHLQWHYRSTHESLIAFSNHKFYKNKMFTFPSANDREKHVKAIHVEGLYSKGTNRKEAEAVVAEIIRRFNDPELKKQSIGVVTFNIKQQALIEDLLSKQFQNNPELDMWASSGEDPLFVKNLENVQGDERDVILFSIGYGPDEKGHVSNNFGPINKTGGSKRLNVAFSRARITMTIFTSMYSTDIKVTDTSPEGVVAFRDFLKFAEGYELDSEKEANYQQAKAGIMENICKKIEEQGYQCTTMVGQSNFRVDIAVINPYETEKYLMGIMLDGDGYRDTKNTRDREVAQINVLNHLGWTLLRVWTIDWWDNRERELNKILSKLDDLNQKAKESFEQKEAKEKALEKEREAQLVEIQKLQEELEKQSEQVLVEEESLDVVEQPIQVEEPMKVEKETSDSIDSLVQKLLDSNVEIVDKRENGGALWIVGGNDLSPIMQEFKEQGIHFSYKEGGGKATGGKDSWWAKTDIQLPVSEEKIVEPIVEKKEELVLEKDSIEPQPYQSVDLESKSMSVPEFAEATNKASIAQTIIKIVEVEAPILKETLMKKVLSSYGVIKNGTSTEAFEKALKYSKVKTVKKKEVIFVWKQGQDPKEYEGIRISSERSGNEICLQEIKNATVYAIKNKGQISKDNIAKEVSIVFGYKRLTKNLETSLLEGIQYAKSTKAIVLEKGIYKLPEE